LNPNFSDAHDLLAYCLVAEGRIQEATDQAKQAVELDPLSLVLGADLGWVYYIQRDYRTAQIQLQKTIDLYPDLPGAHNYMISIFLAQKNYTAAIEQAKSAVTAGGNNPMDIAFLGFAYAASGNKAEAQKILTELDSRSANEYISPYFVGLIYHALGEKEEAFKRMQEACEQRDVVWNMLYLKFDPTFDSVRNDPEFQKVLSCMNL
jgi:tetratricopeptide (TPR) repeat protein